MILIYRRENSVKNSRVIYKNNKNSIKKSEK